MSDTRAQSDDALTQVSRAASAWQCSGLVPAALHAGDPGSVSMLHSTLSTGKSHLRTLQIEPLTPQILVRRILQGHLTAKDQDTKINGKGSVTILIGSLCEHLRVRQPSDKDISEPLSDEKQ